MIYSLLPFAIPVVFLTGVGMMFHKRTRLHARLFLMLAFFMMMTSIRHRHAEDFDMNPAVGPDDFAGVWWNSEDTLRLNGDHTYKLTREGSKYEGTWKSDDWNLYLTPDLHEMEFFPRMVRVNGELRIITHAVKGDPDGWDASPRLKKTDTLPIPVATETATFKTTVKPTSTEKRSPIRGHDRSS